MLASDCFNALLGCGSEKAFDECLGQCNAFTSTALVQRLLFIIMSWQMYRFAGLIEKGF